MTFTLIWVSTSFHRQWFSPKILIQEKLIFTENGFGLKFDFTKKILTPTIFLPGVAGVLLQGALSLLIFPPNLSNKKILSYQYFMSKL